MIKDIEDSLNESIEVKRLLIKDAQKIADAVNMITSAIKDGGKVLIMGNGGSAADAQHIAGELVGRFKCERAAIPAIALSTDTSIITAIGNDYGFECIFSRQIEALAVKGDIVIGITTSGNSLNIIKGLITAKKKGAKTIALTGINGGKAKESSDLCITIPSENTPRIQEAHITLGHIICCEVEKKWVLL